MRDQRAFERWQRVANHLEAHAQGKTGISGQFIRVFWILQGQTLVAGIFT